MSDQAFVVPSILLALVLVASGLLKVRDPGTTEEAFISLRLPDALRRAKVPLMLPWAELLLAVCLIALPGAGHLLATLASFGLFVGYLVVVARALRFPDPVECSCFGKLGTGELTTRTLVRNLILVLLAGLAVLDGFADGDVSGRLRDFDASGWWWLVGVLVAVLLTGLITVGSGSAGEAATELVAAGEGDEYVRHPTPYAMVRHLNADGLVTIRELAYYRPTLLVFLNTTCGACVRTMELLPEWAERNYTVQTFAVSAFGPDRKTYDDLPDLGKSVTWLDQPANNLTRVFDTHPPAAVLLGVDGFLAGGPVQGYEDVRMFLEDIAEQIAEYSQEWNQARLAQAEEALDEPVEG